MKNKKYFNSNLNPAVTSQQTLLSRSNFAGVSPKESKLLTINVIEVIQRYTVSFNNILDEHQIYSKENITVQKFD